MGKSSKKSNVEVAPAAVSSPVSKSTKKGKRDAEVALEKPLSAKKQKKETVEVEIKQKDDKKSKKAPPPKKKPETSSSEDTSSDSEEKVQVAPKKVVQPPVKQPTKQKDDKKSKKAPPKKKVETSSSEDTSSDSDEEVDIAPKVVVEPVKQLEKDSSSSEESSSDEEMKPLSGASTKVPATGIKNVSALASKMEVDSSDEESDSSESDSDEDEGNVKKTVVVNKVVSSQKNVVAQDSSSETSDSESDEEVTAKQAVMIKKPLTKVTASLRKKGESSESSESDSDDEDDTPKDSTTIKSVPTVSKATLSNIPKKKDKQSDSSESQSESEEDEKPQTKPKVEDSSEDSSDESSSEGEEEPQRKKLKVPESTGLNANKPNVKATKKESSSEEDEDDSSEESADEEPPKVQQNKPTKPSTKSSSSPEDSSEDSSEESEDEQQMKTLTKKGINSKDAPSANGTSNQSTKKFDKKLEKTPAGNQSVSSGSKTLFVGNLSYNIGEDDVVEFFKKSGEIIDVRFSKYDDGTMKGFGHVEFASAEEAQKAFKLNGQELFGRAVKLDFARERGDRGERGERGTYTPSSGKENRSFQKTGKGQSNTIFVRGFDKSLDMDQIQSSLEEHFGSCGQITRVSLPRDYDTGGSKGIGYMDFGDGNAFSKALELNGSDLGGYTLVVDEAKPKNDNRDGGRGGGRDGGRSGGWGGRDGGWGGGRGGARGRGGGRGGSRGRGGRDGAYKQTAGTPSQGKKTTFGDD